MPEDPKHNPSELKAVADSPATTSEEPTAPFAGSTSRWADYNTHELLEMISSLEDERRFARLREGIYLAIFIHVLILSAITWIPKYVLHVPDVIDPIDALKKKDLHYLDLPPDALNAPKPQIKITPVKPRIDPKTLDRLQAEQPIKQPTPEVQQTPQPQPEPPKQQIAENSLPAAPTAQPTNPAPAIDSPRPTAVPARPSFATNNLSQYEQLKNAIHGPHASPDSTGPHGNGRMPMHPGAAAGGVQILSDTQGVDFSKWLEGFKVETMRTWDPLIPDEVNAPIYKRGQVMIRFKVLPNGRLMDGSVVLEGRSGDTALDRAAWGALTGSNYPGLPKDFHGPYLELRALFTYNMPQ